MFSYRIAKRKVGKGKQPSYFPHQMPKSGSHPQKSEGALTVTIHRGEPPQDKNQTCSRKDCHHGGKVYTKRTTLTRRDTQELPPEGHNRGRLQFCTQASGPGEDKNG